MATLPARYDSDTNDLSGSDAALLMLLERLEDRGYHFITPTPATHARVVRRAAQRSAEDIRDVLGWSLAFESSVVDREILDLLDAAEAVERLPDGRLRSRYRVSSLGGRLYLHSAYPTDGEDAVFLGPDSYRFADVIRSELVRCPRRAGARLVDIGAGAGVGAIVAARLCPDLDVVMTDINPHALDLARINAAAAGVTADYALGDGLSAVDGAFDLALANPPYIIDDSGRAYRDGGDMHGARAAYDMAAEAIGRLAPEGRFILYTGSPIIAGEDRLRTALTELAARESCDMSYREIDPDVFGEELEKPAYADVDRIAIVAAVITR